MTHMTHRNMTHEPNESSKSETYVEVDLELLLTWEPSEFDAESEAENQPESQNAKDDAKFRLRGNTLNIIINKKFNFNVKNL